MPRFAQQKKTAFNFRYFSSQMYTNCISETVYVFGDFISDVKRGQNLEAETEAEARALRPRPRPRPEL